MVTTVAQNLWGKFLIKRKLLVFDLEIKMTREPVVKKRLLNVTCCFQLLNNFEFKRFVKNFKKLNVNYL